MVISDSFHLHSNTVETEMTVTRQILILHFCDLNLSKSKGIIADEILSKVCSVVSR